MVVNACPVSKLGTVLTKEVAGGENDFFLHALTYGLFVKTQTGKTHPEVQAVVGIMKNLAS